jgi:RNA polymerase sigma-70 factor (ECF subfamily)
MRSDEDLVRAIRRGEARAFDELYARYERRLFGYLLRLLKDRSVAEDLFQDVFFEVLRQSSLPVIEEGRFAGWLFTVARNRALGHLRSVERRKTALEGAELESPRVAAPDETHERKSQLEAMVAALATLSEPHQDALLLKEVGGLTYRQIAAVQDVPEGTAKSRLHFAIKAIRRALGVQGV